MVRFPILAALVLTAGCGNLTSHGNGGGGGGGGHFASGGGGGTTASGGGFNTGGGSTGGGGTGGGGGSATGGGSGGGVSTGGGSGGGVSTGGGTSSTGGGSGNWTFGDAGTFTLTPVVPEAQSSNHGDYDKVSGTGPNDVWVSDSFGFLRHFDGSWALVYDYGTMLRYTGLWVRPDHAVFASGEDALIVCLGNCGLQVSFVTTHLNQHAFTGLCGAGNEVYAAGQTVAGPLVAHFNGTTWDEWPTSLPVTTVGGCAVTSTGQVVLGLSGQVAVFDTDGGFHTEDPGNDTLLLNWTELAPVMDHVVAVGPSKKVSVRDAQGAWSTVTDAPDLDVDSNWLGVASAGGSDAVMVGTSGPAGPVAIYSNGGLTLIQNPLTTTFLGVWAQDENTFWFSGRVDSGDGVLYRATR